MKNSNYENKFLIALSEAEMQNCYGGGWVLDILKWIGGSYTELKKGFLDGLKAI